MRVNSRNKTKTNTKSIRKTKTKNKRFSKTMSRKQRTKSKRLIRKRTRQRGGNTSTSQVTMPNVNGSSGDYYYSLHNSANRSQFTKSL
jgi:hypothetical protein